MAGRCRHAVTCAGFSDLPVVGFLDSVEPLDYGIGPCSKSLSGIRAGEIETATNTVVATIPVGVEPEGVAITPDGTRAYVTIAFGPSVSVIDTATNTGTRPLFVGGAIRR